MIAGCWRHCSPGVNWAGCEKAPWRNCARLESEVTHQPQLLSLVILQRKQQGESTHWAEWLPPTVDWWQTPPRPSIQLSQPQHSPGLENQGRAAPEVRRRWVGGSRLTAFFCSAPFCLFQPRELEEQSLVDRLRRAAGAPPTQAKAKSRQSRSYPSGGPDSPTLNHAHHAPPLSSPRPFQDVRLSSL